MTQPKIYLAGPEVFLAEVHAIATEKKALCGRYGFVGVFPFDAEINDLQDLPLQAQGRRISEENEAMMRGADCVIANCTPFRSVSMDIGTGYEIGFMRGLGKPVFGYTNLTALLRERTERYNETLGPDAIDPYTAGTDIENFDMFENLMIGAALQNFDCDVVRNDAEPGTELTDLRGFEQCLGLARKVFDKMS
ncbi:MAG: nucleoside 2-deoxyribosyltransferase [Hyphomicrobiaceae bacterium]